MVNRPFYVLGRTSAGAEPWVLTLEPRTRAEAERAISWQRRGGSAPDLDGSQWAICTRTGPATFRTESGETWTAGRGPFTESAWRSFLEAAPIFPRVVHQGRRTYWETALGVYQATESPDVPPAANGAGYGDLAALCRLKGDAPPTVVHLARTFEAVRAERYIDRGDYCARPPVLCGSGDGHAVSTLDPSGVNCPACLSRLRG